MDSWISSSNGIDQTYIVILSDPFLIEFFPLGILFFIDSITNISTYHPNYL